MRLLIPLLALFGAVLPLRAQIALAPFQQLVLPAGHSYAIGLEGPIASTPSGGNYVTLFTFDEAYISSANPSWAKVASLSSLSVRPGSQSTVARQSTSAGYFYVTANNGDDQATLFTIGQSPPSVSGTVLQGLDELPRAVAITSDGQFYAVDALGQLWRADDTALTNFTRLTGSITAGSVDDLRIGADGSVYVLNDLREVFRFSPDGVLLNQYTLSHNAGNTPRFAISSTNLLYTLDLGSGMSGIYDPITGAYLGSFMFDSSDLSNGGRAGGNPDLNIWLDPSTGQETMAAMTGPGTYLSLYDVTGVTAIPEPSTYAVLFGAGALAFAAWRRRRIR